MNCKAIQDKIIFYLEGSLSGEETAAIRQHLGSCGKCQALSQEIESTLGWIEKQKQSKPSPFILTRVMASIENRERGKTTLWRGVLHPALVSVAVAAGILFGVFLGINLEQNTPGKAVENLEASYYMDDFQHEPIESFLLDQENNK